MTTTVTVPDRVVLEGVPRVHFYEGGKRCPEDIILPSVVRALLDYLGEKDYGCKHGGEEGCRAGCAGCQVFCTYSFLVGVSGAAAFLSWKDGWHGDNPAIPYMSANPRAAEQRIFEAIGYGYEIVDSEEGRDNELLLREKIAQSIAQGKPVIGYGIVGPPEPAIITGYDERGDVLIGWSFFQSFMEMDAGVDFEPSGYFRKRNWAKDTTGLLIIGDRRPKPSLAETCRRALAWLIEVSTTPLVWPGPDAPERYRQRANGLAAYDAWAEHLLRDEAFPVGNPAMLQAHHQIHNDAVGTVAEARWYGSVWMAEVAEHFAAGPGHIGKTEHVLRAAACYAAEHDLMWEAWELTGGIGNAEAFQMMADPSVRRALADVVRRARDKDAEAVNHMKRALT